MICDAKISKFKMNYTQTESTSEGPCLKLIKIIKSTIIMHEIYPRHASHASELNGSAIDPYRKTDSGCPRLKLNVI